MKAKFKYGIKSFSGTVDDMNFAHYKGRNVTIGRMLPESRRITENNITMGAKMKNIAKLYRVNSARIQEDFAPL